MKYLELILRIHLLNHRLFVNRFQTRYSSAETIISIRT